MSRKSPQQTAAARASNTQRVALVGRQDDDHRAITGAILSAVYAVMPPGSAAATDFDIQTRSLPMQGTTAQCEVTVKHRPTPKVSNGLATPKRRAK